MNQSEPSAGHDNTSERQMLFGAGDWLMPEWIARYYPSDLPQDWRLSYCANELDCLLVPEARWLQQAKHDLEQWQQDVPDHFLFFLRLDQSSRLPEARQALKLLGAKAGGIVVSFPIEDEGLLIPLTSEEAQLSLWGTDGTLQLAHLQVAGSDLRAQRKLLEYVARLRGDQPVSVIIEGPGVTPVTIGKVRELAELMDIA
ncbi:MAG: hypothetical protein ACWA5Q_06090 [bacterium]